MTNNFNYKMITKSLLTFNVIIIFLIFLTSCGNSNSENKSGDSKNVDSSKISKLSGENKEKTESDKSTVNESSALLETSSEKSGILTVKASLEKAKKDGNSVFMVVTGTGDTELAKALLMAGSANKSVKKSVVVQMNRDDKINANLVTEYGVASAPLPLILVFSPNSVLAGGYLLTEATADKLVKLIPSPKHDAVLQALNNKKSVYIVATKKSFTDKAKVIENCKAAVVQMAYKAELIQIDMDDAKEKTFLELLKINTSSASAATVVINSRGQISGTFYELKDAATLVALAKKVSSGGCAPGACGGNKSCGK
ncbi:MAG: hypothetical protein HGB12_03275 [Bacteroidetes bacterium]|nr:hypothetical protein [Bacteroidota bacterium]